MVSEIVNFFMAPLLGVNVEQIVADTIDAHDRDIEELQRKQFAEGQKADGSEIEPYKPSTIKQRRREGLQTSVTDYKRSGEFYKKTYAKRTTGGTEVNSADPKTKFLIKRSGEGIFGLTVASKVELAERMRPTLQDKFNQAIK